MQQFFKNELCMAICLGLFFFPDATQTETSQEYCKVQNNKRLKS